MNLGQRVRGAFDALSGNLSAEVAANTSADASFREQTESALLAAGAATTELRTAFEALAARVEAGETVNPEDFADLKSKIDSLDAAFPDTDQQPPEDDDGEDDSDV